MNTPPHPLQDRKKQEDPVGPTAAIIIVVLLMALGGIYFFVTKEKELKNPPADTPLFEDGASTL